MYHSNIEEVAVVTAAEVVEAVPAMILQRKTAGKQNHVAAAAAVGD